MNFQRCAAIWTCFLPVAICLWCLDGSECHTSDTCALCEGASCLRIQRPHPVKGMTTAMTCLPHDSLIHAYYPEGCRMELSSGEKMCLCSERDFCNTSSYHSPYFVLLVIFVSFINFA